MKSNAAYLSSTLNILYFRSTLWVSYNLHFTAPVFVCDHLPLLWFIHFYPILYLQFLFIVVFYLFVMVFVKDIKLEFFNAIQQQVSITAVSLGSVGNKIQNNKISIKVKEGS